MSRAREEQLWEQQRIVTQLKRNLRVARTRQEEEQTHSYEEDLDFALQTPATADTEKGLESVDRGVATKELRCKEPVGKEVTAKEVESKVQAGKELGAKVAGAKEVEVKPQEASSPDDGAARSQEHRITVQVHQEGMEVREPPFVKEEVEEKGFTEEVEEIGFIEEVIDKKVDTAKEAVKGHVTVIQLNQSEKPEKEVDDGKDLDLVLETQILETPSKEVVSSKIQPEILKLPPALKETIKSAQKDTTSDKSEPTKEPAEEERVREKVSFSSTGLPPSRPPPSGTIPLLPPPPPSLKPSTRAAPSQRALAPPEQRTKSRSLPRGLPSEGVFEGWEHQQEQRTAEEARKDALLLEEMRLKFEYEEMLNLKSELERRRRTERREIAELQEEIATMQTLYQYRTYSVDSSEESSGEEQDTARSQEVRQEKLALLHHLRREKRELEQRKVEMQGRLQEERAACLQLRVNIRMEQERIKKIKLVNLN